MLPLLLVLLAADGRVTLPLDGDWDIAESVAATQIPARFTHRVPVPGLVNLSQPPFPDVDQFDSREIIDNRVRRKQLPESARTTAAGVTRQQRSYFWYRRTFRAPARRQVAVLRVNKAQFGTAVWLNGKPVGEYNGCFSAGYFNVTSAIDWTGDNTLLIRIGAHPLALLPSVPAGTDFEKLKWTPGIYDSVSLHLSDNPVIETLQVAPRIASSEIVVQTRLRNHGSAPASFTLRHAARTWKDNRRSGKPAILRLTLAAGEERTVTQTLALPSATLWSPENPFLYVLDSSTGGDSVSTRFGMRELLFDTATRRAYLNGKVYFLRGSNITLHRFLEDPKAGRLSWDEKWVRKLLAEIPKRMHWNSFRFCIGPVPDRWLDIADEAGLLIQNEFFIWTGRNAWHSEWDTQELIRQYSDWMRDNWNHPSVAIWDANNETIDDVLGPKVIPLVRKLDLSNRPWDNGYNLPVDPNDPVEDHPYLFSRAAAGRTPQFKVTDLETLAFNQSINMPHPTGHAVILNEYGWLWLNRDGSPTLLTREIYDTLLGPSATGEERLSLYGYLLGGLTEFWRSRRTYAGVLHFVYLTASFPGVYTSDHFRDIERLELDPTFADHVGEAFKPLGVYINFWQPELTAGTRRRFAVSLINDAYEPARGTLVLSLEAGGRELVRTDTAFDLPGLGQHSYSLDLEIPRVPGNALLKATAGSTLSRRRVSIVVK